MRKIVSNVLIVSTQLIIGGLFLFMLFSDSNEDNKVVVVENDNLNKMADAVSELFIDEQVNDVAVDDSAEVDLVSQEEKEAQEEAERLAAEEAARLAAEEAERLAAEEAARLAAEEAARKSYTSGSNSVESLQAYAYDLVINTYGWTVTDFDALVLLWDRESGWNPNASNGSAYGIPQALPGSKMASAGDDYYTNGETQIRWGLGYIKSTYGTPSSAWEHFLNYNWY